jgi:hypothetical protein
MDLIPLDGPRPTAPASGSACVRPHRRRRPLAWLPLLVVGAVVLVACGGGGGGTLDEPGTSGSPSASPIVDPMSDGSPEPSPDVAAVLCERIGFVQAGLARVQAVELRATAKTSLDIEFGRVDSAFSELRQTEMGEGRVTLAAPLRRLYYRVEDLRLSVEDFRTTSRLREAAAHVEKESEALADALAAFSLLAGC